MAVTAALADANVRTGVASIASVPFGTAATGRVIFAIMNGTNAAGNTLYPSTIGGVAAARQELFSGAAVVATGTTGTLAITGAAQMNSTGVYALSGSPNLRPATIVNVQAASLISESITVSVNAGSTVIAQAGNFNSIISPVFTAGVTSDGTFNDGSSGYNLGHADQASAGPVTVTATGADYLSVYVFDTIGPDWQLIGANTPVVASSGNVNLGAEPTGTAQNDVLVAFIGYRSTPAFTLPSGWSSPNTQQSSGNTIVGSGGIGSGVMAYAIRGVSTPASFTFTRTAGSVAAGRVYAFRSSTAGTPSFDVGSSATQGSATTTATAPSVTGSVSGDLVVAMFVRGDGATFPLSFSAATTPANSNNSEFMDNSTSPDVSLFPYIGETSASGATGTFSAPLSGSSRNPLLVALFSPPSSVVASLPFNQSDFSTPRRIRQSGFDLSGPLNPNIFINPVPSNQFDFLKPYQIRHAFPPTDPVNINLFTNPIPILNFGLAPRPAPHFNIDSQPYNPNLYTVAVAFPFTAQPIPPALLRAFAPTLQAYNPNLYTLVAYPLNQYDFATSARRRFNPLPDFGYNLNLYSIVALPFNQYSYPAARRTSSIAPAPFGLNPNLFTNSIPTLNLATPSVHHPLPTPADLSLGFQILLIPITPPSTTLIQRTLTGVGL